MKVPSRYLFQVSLSVTIKRYGAKHKYYSLIIISGLNNKAIIAANIFNRLVNMSQRVHIHIVQFHLQLNKF